MIHTPLLGKFLYSFVKTLLKHYSKAVFIVMVPLCLIGMLIGHYNCIAFSVRHTPYSSVTKSSIVELDSLIATYVQTPSVAPPEIAAEPQFHYQKSIF